MNSSLFDRVKSLNDAFGVSGSDAYDAALKVLLESGGIPSSVSDVVESIPDLEEFYNDKLYLALDAALKRSRRVLSLPELIDLRCKAAKHHLVWKDEFDVLSEEFVGVDTHGRFYDSGVPVVVVLHGVDFIGQDRIRDAVKGGKLINGAVPFSQGVFDGFLADLSNGIVNGFKVDVVMVEDLLSGSKVLNGVCCAVVMPYSVAKDTCSGFQRKDVWVNNPLVIARNAGSQNLNEYFDLFKDSDGEVGCWHPFDDGFDPTVCQARVLFFCSRGDGLNGYDDFDGSGRFLGVGKNA